MTTIATISARQMLADHTRLGLAIPKEIQKAQTDSARIREGLEALRVSPDQLAHVALQAMIDGRDPATDPEVTRLLNVRALSLAMGGTEELAQQRFLIAVQASAQTLINAWKKTFNEAGAVLREEHVHLGDVDLNKDADEILLRGGDIAVHFVNARNANDRIENVLDAYQGLNLVLNTVNNRETRTLVMTPATLQQWEDHDLYRRLSGWDLTKLGLTLDLADHAELAARVAAHQATRDQRSRNAQDAETGRVPNLARMMGR